MKEILGFNQKVESIWQFYNESRQAFTEKVLNQIGFEIQLRLEHQYIVKFQKSVQFYKFTLKNIEEFVQYA
jgi:hypothetical protein